jgi:CheY-like chemotaxis protein
MEASCKVMVVDDDRDLVQSIQDALEARQYTVATAHSGGECLDRVNEECPDLILLDVMMDGLSEGFGVVHELRSKAPDSEYAACADIPIILMTGVQRKTKLRFSDIVGSEALPVQDFIAKPFAPRELLARVEKVLQERQTQR